MVGTLVRVKDSVEELVRIVSNKYGIPSAKVRNYLILIGMRELLRSQKKHKIGWRMIMRLERVIRKELGGTES